MTINCHAGFCYLVIFMFLVFAIVKCDKYVVFTEPVNWYQALINCKSEGMELASLHSEEEHNNLNRFLSSNGYDKGYWLGATKEGNGEFYWVATGLKMVYTKWLNGQPENAKFDANYMEGEHCLGWGMPNYSPAPSGWNDLTCFNTMPYICQKNEECFE